MEAAFVYWIFDETCSNHLTDGYVGVTKDLNRRFKFHLRSRRVPIGSKIQVLFSGTRDECFIAEKKYRPTPGVGWNSAVGGAHGYQVGFKHSTNTREKLKAAWTPERKAIHAERLSLQSRKLKGQKRPKQSVSISGEANGMFGKQHSKEAKEKMSLSRLGRTPHNKGKSKYNERYKES